MKINRLDFLRLAGAAGLAWTLPAYAQATETPTLRLGVGADLHHDVVPDGSERLAALIKASQDFRAHAIVQLGDFCQPKPANLPLLKQWRAAVLPQIDVIGNHDMDGGSTPAKTAAWLGLKSRYSTHVVAGHRIIVLDGNEKPTDHTIEGYTRFIGPEQLAWLQSALALDTLPVVLFCHQGLDGIEGGIENAAAVRSVLEEANRKAGGARIRLVLNGHHHLDYLVEVSGIPYLQVNSMSYHWTGKAARPGRFPAEVEASHPYLKMVIPYKDPVFALIEFTPTGGRVVGRASEFIGEPPEIRVISGHPVVAKVSDANWSLKR
jgi:hypothetical protein